MKDQNEVRLTGTIDKTRRIATKTGAPMAEVILTVRQDRFRITAFGNVAEHLLARANAGDRLSVTGSLSVSSWKDETTGEWRNSFAVQAWGVELHGEKVSYERKQQAPPVKSGRRNEGYTAGPNDPF
ncbi:MAG: single-stranded DNA-binding protein [Syntrophobacteraceae bacterium]